MKPPYAPRVAVLAIAVLLTVQAFAAGSTALGHLHAVGVLFAAWSVLSLYRRRKYDREVLERLQRRLHR